jgi:hypothetical protein
MEQPDHSFKQTDPLGGFAAQNPLMMKLEITAEAVEKAVWYPLLMFLSKLFNLRKIIYKPL